MKLFETRRSAAVGILLLAFAALCAAVLAAAALYGSRLPDIVGRDLAPEEQAEVISRNSSLTDYVRLSPNADFPREGEIRKITIHRMDTYISLENLGTTSFANRDQAVSANYAIDTDGNVGLYVEESNRAWSLDGPENDNQAVTIEVAADRTGISDAAFGKLIELCVDVCRRNGIEELVWIGDESGSLTAHRMFSDTDDCPGAYLMGRMSEIADLVNAGLAEPPDPSGGIAADVARPDREEIQDRIGAIASKYGAVGAQVAVIEGGRLADTYAYGWAVMGKEEMTADHKLPVASLTKVGVGIAAMILWEDGVIDLDEDIGTYWGVRAANPYYPDDPVSIRSLLTHTSSIYPLDDSVPRTYGFVRDYLESGGYESVRPGDAGSWRYNNYAYGVLGQTLELASGRYLDDIMGERVWDVMGIDAAFESGNIADKDLLAAIYRSGAGVGRTVEAMADSVREGEPGSTGRFFSGGMTISAADMGRMTAMLATDGVYEGQRILQEGTIGLMQERLEPELGDGSYQALALRSMDGVFGRDRIYYHTGSSYGAYSMLSYDPNTGDGVVVITTGASGAADDRGMSLICGEISRYIYEILEMPADADEDGARLILANPWNAIPEDYAADLRGIVGGGVVNAACYDDLMEMLSACRDVGLRPAVISAYRTREKQERLFRDGVGKRVAAGLAKEDAILETAMAVAAPGTSEHELGLAVDIADSGYQLLDEAQAETSVQEWLMENCWDYGFILRYPEDKGDITGIVYEPWHYRYVGRAAAKEIRESGLCLEEYLGRVESDAPRILPEA